MAKLALNPEYGLYERDGHAFASSRDVAETFGKRHADVLRDIAKITAPKSGVSKDFTQRNFALSEYRDSSGKKNPEYLLTKDGFTIVTFGFTGKKAMAFKEAYIRRFNEMEDFIKDLALSRMDFPAFTNAVMLAHEEPKQYHFSNEINMIYRIIFGVDAKQLRLERGIKPGESVRPFLSAYEIAAITELQRADIGMLYAGLEYAQRKESLNRTWERVKNSKRLLSA